MNWARTVANSFALLAALGLSAGCATSAPSTGYTPVTGIQILASTIVAGHGCGTGPNQVFKYVAVVSYTGPDGGPVQPALTSGVFDCFSDGIFSNLNSDGGLQAFQIAIFAYNQDSFPQALECPANPPNASPCPGDDAGNVLPWEGSANWTTTCAASQFSGATLIAACAMLEPSLDAAANVDGSSEAEPNDATPDADDSTADASSAD